MLGYVNQLELVRNINVISWCKYYRTSCFCLTNPFLISSGSSMKNVSGGCITLSLFGPGFVVLLTYHHLQASDISKQFHNIYASMCMCVFLCGYICPHIYVCVHIWMIEASVECPVLLPYGDLIFWDRAFLSFNVEIRIFVRLLGQWAPLVSLSTHPPALGS